MAAERIIGPMDLGIRGRRAVVGGASSGLGAAIADRLAAEGCRLLIWARNQDRLERTASELRDRHGVDVGVASVDAGNPDAPDRLADAVASSFGAADICVLNAGGPPTVDPLETTAEAWHEAFQAQAVTPILIGSRLIGPMREAGWGRIVACLSWTVKEPISNLVYSTGGRSALTAWLKTVAPVVAADGVTVNGVLTGPMATERVDDLDRERADRENRSFDDVRRERLSTIPAGRLGDPAEIASFVAYLCSAGAAFQTGTFTLVDGGLIRSL